MLLGDLVRIKTIRGLVVGVVVEEPDEASSGWAGILDQTGKIIWWPPEEVAHINGEIAVIETSEASDDLERH